MTEGPGVLSLLDPHTGELIAELWYSEAGPSVWNISHMYTERAHRGKGYASQLMEAICKKAKAEHKTLMASCSYSSRWLALHSECSSLLHKK